MPMTTETYIITYFFISKWSDAFPIRVALHLQAKSYSFWTKFGLFTKKNISLYNFERAFMVCLCLCIVWIAFARIAWYCLLSCKFLVYMYAIKHPWSSMVLLCSIISIGLCWLWCIFVSGASIGSYVSACVDIDLGSYGALLGWWQLSCFMVLHWVTKHRFEQNFVESYRVNGIYNTINVTLLRYTTIIHNIGINYKSLYTWKSCHFCDVGPSTGQYIQLAR